MPARLPSHGRKGQSSRGRRGFQEGQAKTLLMIREKLAPVTKGGLAVAIVADAANGLRPDPRGGEISLDFGRKGSVPARNSAEVRYGRG